MGSPKTPPPKPVSSTSPFLDTIAPTQLKSNLSGSCFSLPKTIPAFAALSAIVSNTVREAPVFSSFRTIRVSRISIDGQTYSVADNMSDRDTFPLRSDLITNAISASIRGWINLPKGTISPF